MWLRKITFVHQPSQVTTNQKAKTNSHSHSKHFWWAMVMRMSCRDKLFLTLIVWECMNSYLPHLFHKEKVLCTCHRTNFNWETHDLMTPKCFFNLHHQNLLVTTYPSKVCSMWSGSHLTFFSCYKSYFSFLVPRCRTSELYSLGLSGGQR